MGRPCAIRQNKGEQGSRMQRQLQNALTEEDMKRQYAGAEKTENRTYVGFNVATLEERLAAMACVEGEASGYVSDNGRVTTKTPRTPPSYASLPSPSTREPDDRLHSRADWSSFQAERSANNNLRQFALHVNTNTRRTTVTKSGLSRRTEGTVDATIYAVNAITESNPSLTGEARVMFKRGDGCAIVVLRRARATLQSRHTTLD